MNERLRIGDAEREAAAHELGEHFAMGRITAEEHSERLEQIWAARTAADLAPAFRDLPQPRAAQPPQRPAATSPAVRRGRGWHPDVPRLPFPFKLLLAIVVIWWGFTTRCSWWWPRSCTSCSSGASPSPALARAVHARPLPGGLALTVLLTWRFCHAVRRLPGERVTSYGADPAMRATFRRRWRGSPRRRRPPCRPSGRGSARRCASRWTGPSRCAPCSRPRAKASTSSAWASPRCRWSRRTASRLMKASIGGSPDMLTSAQPTISPSASVTTRKCQGSKPGRPTSMARKSSYGSRSRTDHSRKASSITSWTAGYSSGVPRGSA